MDASIASLNRSTFEERQKNVTYLRSLYFLLAIQLGIAVGWCFWVINDDALGGFVKRFWGIALAVGIICVLLVLAVYFVPSLNNGGAGIGIYALFTLCAAYLWGYFCSLDTTNNWALYVLLLLTAVAVGFAAYTL
jgi:FtsH-binding integral membrane protein